MGMRGERNTWLSCTALLHMLNIMPLERQHEEKSSGRKQTTRVAGLNMTENQQDREDSGKESEQERQWQGALEPRASERFSKPVGT